MISSYKTAFFRLSFTVAADVYELVLLHDEMHNTSATERADVWPSVLSITTLGKGISSGGPLLRARHPPPTACIMYACTMYIILLSRQYAADRRVAAASGSTLFSKWGKSSGFYRLERRGSAAQGCIGFGV